MVNKRDSLNIINLCLHVPTNQSEIMWNQFVNKSFTWTQSNIWTSSGEVLLNVCYRPGPNQFSLKATSYITKWKWVMEVPNWNIIPPWPYFGTWHFGKRHFGLDISSPGHFGSCIFWPCGRTGTCTFCLHWRFFRHRDFLAVGHLGTRNFRHHGHFSTGYFGSWTFQHMAILAPCKAIWMFRHSHLGTCATVPKWPCAEMSLFQHFIHISLRKILADRLILLGILLKLLNLSHTKPY